MAKHFRIFIVFLTKKEKKNLIIIKPSVAPKKLASFIKIPYTKLHSASSKKLRYDSNHRSDMAPKDFKLER